MGQRKKLIRPANLVKKYGEYFPIWSYSRLSTYHNCKHEYLLARILKKENEQNLYGLLGGISHDILQDLYEDKITYADMIKRFETDFLDIEISDIYKFSADEDKNESMKSKYKKCMVHFFNNHKPVQSKVLCEREVWVDINGNVFIGYVDAIHKEDGKYIITDYKTSSMGAEYRGESLLHKQEQLLLYALALHQKGVPLEDIGIRWNFLKYTNIRYDHMINVTYEKETKGEKALTTSCVKKSEWVSKIATQLRKDLKEYDVICFSPKEIRDMVNEAKESNSLDCVPQAIKDKYVLSPVIKTGERHKWVESIKTQLKKDLKEYEYTDVDIELMIHDSIVDNTLDNIPEEIAKNYISEDAYVYGEVTKELVDKLITNMTDMINEIKANGDDEENWQDNKLAYEKNSYYCNCLCGVSKDCKYYKEMIDRLKAEQEGYMKEYDMLSELENL